jgi:hypothetical protein
MSVYHPLGQVSSPHSWGLHTSSAKSALAWSAGPSASPLLLLIVS